MKTKDTAIYIKLSKAEYESIQKRMHGIGFKSLSAYIRKMALNGLCINLDLKIIQDLNFQIQKIGININQVVKHANEVKAVSREDILYLRKELQSVHHMVRSVSEELSSFTKF